MREKNISIILVVSNGLVKKYFWYRKVCAYEVPHLQSGPGTGYASWLASTPAPSPPSCP